MNKKRLNDTGILDKVRQLVNTERRKRIFGLPQFLRRPIRRLVQALHTARSSHPLFFLDAQFERRNNPPNIAIISSLCNQTQKLPTEEQKLSRLWIAIRELMSMPYTEIYDKTLLSYWNQILSNWARTGAWYGLHGHTPLGCLAALNSLTEVRRRLADKFATELSPGTIAYPGGALSSAKYSIAKHLYVMKDRRDMLNDALADVQLALKESKANEDGLIAISGSTLRKLHRFSQAVADYETVYRIRQNNGASDNKIGEALSELGFGYLCQGKLRKGRGYCEKGVRLLRGTESPGFLVRALRKLAIIYLVTGHLHKAYETWTKARQITSARGIFDQL